MKRLYLIFVFPAIVFAGNIDLSLNKHNGESFYIVNSNIYNLKSKLVFPFNFNTIDLEYEHKLKYFDISLNSSFLIDARITKGKDYDWQNGNLTVFSKSDNKVDKYDVLGITLKKNIYNNLEIFAKFEYKVLDIHWANTYQEDYIKKNNEYILGNTLKFEQDFYKYYLGFNYKNRILKNVSLELVPSFVYAFVNTKDTHLLRDFYTLQNTKALGYKIKCKLNYNITGNSDLKLSVSHTKIEDKSVNMDYHNRLGEKYLSYPSSYSYKNTIVGIHYSYSF